MALPKTGTRLGTYTVIAAHPLPDHPYRNCLVLVITGLDEFPFGVGVVDGIHLDFVEWHQFHTIADATAAYEEAKP